MLVPKKHKTYRVKYKVIEGHQKGVTYTRYWGKVEEGLRVGSVRTFRLTGGRTESHKVIEFSILGGGKQ